MRLLTGGLVLAAGLVIWFTRLVWLSWLGFGQANPAPVYTLSGTTMGTIAYTVRYISPTAAPLTGLQDSLNYLLAAFNKQFSTYDTSAWISRFNNPKTSVLAIEDSLWYPLLELSQDLHQQTQGAFDPTLGALIDFWGFGAKEILPTDSLARAQAHQALLDCVGMQGIAYDRDSLRKHNPCLSLNLSAIAKGYAVDRLGAYLRAQNIVHFLLDIGGELLASGQPTPDRPWIVGIQNPLVPWRNQAVATLNMTTLNTPTLNSTPQGISQGISQVISKVISQGALASSGNYRNMRRINNTWYAHTLNPKTGYPSRNKLLGATIWVQNKSSSADSSAYPTYPTAYADALATACMVLGAGACADLMQSLPYVEALLLVQAPYINSVEDSLYIYASSAFIEALQETFVPTYDIARYGAAF